MLPCTACSIHAVRAGLRYRINMAGYIIDESYRVCGAGAWWFGLLKGGYLNERDLLTDRSIVSCCQTRELVNSR